MAITFRGSAHPNVGGGTSSSISVSSTSISSIAANDVVVLMFYIDQNNTSITPPAGWTLIDNQNNSGGPFNMVTYRHVYTSSEPANWTFTLGASVFWDFDIVAFTGCNTTTPLDTHNIQNSNVAASLAYNGADAIILCNINYTGTAVSASGYTTLQTADGLYIGYKIATSAGSTGSVTCTGGGGAETTSLITLSPAGGGGTAWNQSVSDSHSGLDLLVKSASKTFPDAQSGQDTLTKLSSHVVSDAFSQLDVLAKMSAKTFIELFSEFDSATATRQVAGTAWQRNISDAHSALDVLRRSSTKLTTDQWSSIDAVTRVWIAHLLITEVFSAVDTLTKQVTHGVRDTVSGSDTAQALRGALLTVLDTFSSRDVQQRLVQHAVADTQSGQDATLKQVQHAVVDSLSQTDRVTAGRSLLLLVLDAISQRDGVAPSLFTLSGRKTLAMVTSLVASSLGINIVLLAPLIGAYPTNFNPLSSTNTVLSPTLGATTSSVGTLSATASLL